MKSSIALSILAVLPLTAATAQTPAEDRAHARDCAVMQALVTEQGALIAAISLIERESEAEVLAKIRAIIGRGS